MEHILIELAASRGQDQKHVLCTWMELLTCSMLAMWRYRIACFEKLYYDQRNMLANFSDKIILECLFFVSDLCHEHFLQRCWHSETKSHAISINLEMAQQTLMCP